MGISTTALSEQKQASKPQGNRGSGVYEIVTKQILALLEKGTIPWRRPWSLITGDEPMNVQGNLYRGANYFLLSALDYDRPIFLTFRQAIELGGNVRRGEKGFPVYYYDFTSEGLKEVCGGGIDRILATLLAHGWLEVTKSGNSIKTTVQGEQWQFYRVLHNKVSEFEASLNPRATEAEAESESESETETESEAKVLVSETLESLELL